MRELDPTLVLAHLPIGRSAAISAPDLWRKLTGEAVDTGEPARELRDVVVALREMGHPVCSDRHGYYLAANEQELLAAAETLFRRAMTGLRQVAAMRKQALPDLAGQLGLKLK